MLPIRNDLTWRKATRSQSDGGACVEVAAHQGTAVRDSKNPKGPHLTFSPDEWRAFTARVRSGDFDL
ncbi:DUF397 domain-containing protein [Actinomadura oligospora]|uniref:DUF397 domain-containing protein n=1 Tax=Actinomadura oligospora TaxID=111804 RepID=UPI00047E10DD|nr:DUF397 domain-containing protein [Actinomadura oligospora]